MRERRPLEDRLDVGPRDSSAALKIRSDRGPWQLYKQGVGVSSDEKRMVPGLFSVPTSPNTQHHCAKRGTLHRVSTGDRVGFRIGRSHGIAGALRAGGRPAWLQHWVSSPHVVPALLQIHARSRRLPVCFCTENSARACSAALRDGQFSHTMVDIDIAAFASTVCRDKLHTLRIGLRIASLKYRHLAALNTKKRSGIR